MPAAEVEPVRRDEGRRVEKNVPALLVRLLDPFEGMLDAREVRLRGIGEEPVADLRALVQVPLEHAVEHAQVGRHDGDVFRDGAADPVVLAQPVHRVVVVEAEEEDVPGAEGISLADELAARASRSR